jgi:hypothetical protein
MPAAAGWRNGALASVRSWTMRCGARPRRTWMSPPVAGCLADPVRGSRRPSYRERRSGSCRLARTATACDTARGLLPAAAGLVGGALGPDAPARQSRGGACCWQCSPADDGRRAGSIRPPLTMPAGPARGRTMTPSERAPGPAHRPSPPCVPFVQRAAMAGLLAAGSARCHCLARGPLIAHPSSDSLPKGWRCPEMGSQLTPLSSSRYNLFCIVAFPTVPG